MKLYKVRMWDANFETARTRQVDKLRWVPIPNKHDGEGLLTIFNEPDGIKIYGCWLLILQVASKCQPRGVLVKDSGVPHTAESIALKTGWRNPADFEKALSFLSDRIDWLFIEEKDKSDAVVTPECRPTDVKVSLKEGKEGKEKNTWLTPYFDLWIEILGGEPSAGELAKYMKPLDEKHGPEICANHLRRYLEATTAQYVSIAKFSQTFGAWRKVAKKKPVRNMI